MWAKLPRGFGGRATTSKKRKARQLRRDATPAEALLWQRLRASAKPDLFPDGRWRRQRIALGWILDFYCHQFNLAVEIDGGYHATAEQQERDAYRTRCLEDYGVRVLRFTNEQVLTDIESVLRAIREEANRR